MEGLKDRFAEVAEALTEAERTRELALADSRKVIRLSKNVIHAIHVGTSCEGPRKEMEALLSSLLGHVSDDMRYSGPVADAMMEASEAEMLYDVAFGNPIRSYMELGVTPQSWVMGLADAIGELRRMVVTALMDGRRSDAERLFSAMEDMSEELLMLDVPDAVAPVRRKQDVARGIVEKTRSDMLGSMHRF